MLKQFINNVLIILAGAVIFIVLPKFLKSILQSIWNKIEYSKLINNQYMQDIKMFIQKNEVITKILKLIFIYSVLLYFVEIQEAYSLLKFGDEDSYVILIISVLTVYGIFYTFIQFALNYILQSGKDRYWGRSKIKTLLIGSFEYRFFNSNEFKILLLISAIVPVLRETIENNPYLSQYYNFIMALFCISLATIYVLYALLFIRSIDIMNNFFNIQEGNDFGLKLYMENVIKNEYRIVFNQSYEYKDDLFCKSLFENLLVLNKAEKGYMFNEVLYYSFSDLLKRQDMEIEKIKHNPNINLKTVDEFKAGIYYLENIFINIWKYVEENIELDFVSLLALYRLQDKVLFKQIYIANSGNFDEIEKEICNHKIYFKVPNIVWKKAININDVYHVHKFIKNREIDGKMLQEYFSDSVVTKLNRYQRMILDEYYNYTYELLNKCKELQNQINQKDLLNLLSSFLNNEENLKINMEMQKIIYSYMVELEWNYSNKEFISLLLKNLDDVYTTTIILYMMLYTGQDSYSKWKKDVLFLHNIIYNNYYYEYIIDEEKVDFICENISKSNIGHKISNDLIKWIIYNINTPIEEHTIQECIKYRYFTYAHLIKLKFIFDINNNYSFDFRNITLDNVATSTIYDWRIVFFEEMLLSPSLLKEDFFCKHQFYFFEYILQPSIPKELYEAQDFRIIYINSCIEISKIQFLQMISEKYFLRKGIFEFLILKINDESYEYLLSDIEVSKIFINKVKEIIDNSNFSVESYINNLVEKANECSCTLISDYKKNSILYKLNSLIY